MKKIKETLIHWLGGLTTNESIQSDKNSFDIGHFKAFADVKDFADSLYGLNAEEWCKKMYEFIEKKIDG